MDSVRAFQRLGLSGAGVPGLLGALACASTVATLVVAACSSSNTASTRETGDASSALSTCDDGRKTGRESDIDCGGICKPCSVGRHCAANADCLHALCTGGWCVEPSSCSDGIKGGDESDVDCGGACRGCSADQTCAQPADCASGVCTGGTCKPSSCSDGVKNGDEGDVDCGGSSCSRCTLGKTCESTSDCAAGTCKNGVCQPATCTDGVTNGNETDVDCGGGDCTKCGAGAVCVSVDDCRVGACEGGHCTCSSSTTACGDSCVDLATDDTHCGACDNACGEGRACASSACVGTGVWSFTATWSSPGNVDLMVRTPTGNVVSPAAKGPDVSTDFGRMDREVTLGAPSTGPENVYWDADHPPPPGTYDVCVSTANFAEDILSVTPFPMDVTVIVRRNGVVHATLNRTIATWRESATECTATTRGHIGSAEWTDDVDAGAGSAAAR